MKCWYDLERVLMTWAGWRRPPPEGRGLWGEMESRVQEQVWSKEMNVMAETLADELMREGQVQQARKMLRALLEDRFGSLPLSLQQRIDAVNDTDRLQQAAVQVWRIQKIDDLPL